jgi:hypothetical protein
LTPRGIEAARYQSTFPQTVEVSHASCVGFPDERGRPPCLVQPHSHGAHGVISAAGARVLTAFFGRDPFDFSVTSEVLPGVERSFHTFGDAAHEASRSRIFAGQHFRFDQTAGERLGREIAAFVVEGFLTPRHRDEVFDDR